MTLPVTVGDRFRAAWKAFRQNRKPDPEAFQKFLEKQEAERTAALDKLDGFDKALVRSVASATSNWERLLPQVMPAIERLDTADQMKVMLYISKGNPHASIQDVVRAWCTKRENLKMLLAHSAEKEHSVVVVRE